MQLLWSLRHATLEIRSQQRAHTMIDSNKIYLVGGAVRDKLQGRPVKDRDYVVVGVTPDQMLAAGYQQVGADFPVFLHPETGEEYALARTERKSGHGYHGFEVHTSPSVTLEEDLFRRDLTVNAMAMDSEGRIIDPYGGMKDIENKVFRHTSDALSEDPVRVLRVARMMARMSSEGWRVAPETMALMTEISQDCQLSWITPERVWKELSRALLEKTPSAFISTLRECQGLSQVLPEVDALFGVPQPKEHHPEIDTGIHTMMVMDMSELLSDRLEVRFGAMVHDLGKAVTDPENWPKHHKHEMKGIDVVEAMCDRLRVPNNIRAAGVQASEFHTHVHRAKDLDPKTVVKMFDRLNVKNKPRQLADLLLIAEADARGRTGFEDRRYPQADHLRDLAKHYLAVNAREIAARCAGDGDAIRDAIRKASVQAIKQALRFDVQVGRNV